MAKKVLVVGGAGYIGGALIDRLMKSKIDFAVYDNLLYENRYLKPVNFIYGDVRDTEKLGKIINNYDIIVWLAAIVGDGACATNPERTIAVNEESVKWLAENFKGRIIFTSTCSVYGANKEHNLTEISDVNPLSLYAGTKLTKRGNSVIFRLGTLHGIGDTYARPRLDLVINILTMKAVLGEPLTIFGGEQWRPVVHVRDIAEALYQCLLEKPEWQSLEGIFNIAQENIMIRDLVNTIKEIVPKPIDVVYQDMKYEDLRDYHVSTKKLQDYTNWLPKITVAKSIEYLTEVYMNRRVKDPTESVFHNEKFLKSL